MLSVVLVVLAQTHERVDLVSWQGGALPPRYERSAQLPLASDELVKLSAEGFTAPQLTKMVQERRCACDASADGLIALKRAGVAGEVLNAVSLHALPPNRELSLQLTLDFSGAGGEVRKGLLYVFIDDGEVVRVLTAPLDALLARAPAATDKSDLLVERSVRRVELWGKVPLKTYGVHHVTVVSSGNPSLTQLSQLSAAEVARARSFEFQWPRASLGHQCRLTARYKRDALLAQWNDVGGTFQCEFN
ncbi:MAG: hypothetical protein IPJ65_23805 [Archangiaceae bacterium]|nr:hypothetical protein [Archangiaceae bacterium]